MNKNIEYDEFEQLLSQCINMPKSIVSAVINMMPNIVNKNDVRFIVHTDENKPGIVNITASEIIGLNSFNYYYLINFDNAKNEYNIVVQCKHDDLATGRVKFYSRDSIDVKHTQSGFNDNPGYIVKGDHRFTQSDNYEYTTLYDELDDTTRYFDDNEIEVHTDYQVKKFAKRKNQYNFTFGLPQRNTGYVIETINSFMNRDDMGHASMQIDIYDGNNVLTSSEIKYYQIHENRKEMSIVGIVSNKEYEESKLFNAQNKMGEDGSIIHR